VIYRKRRVFFNPANAMGIVPHCSNKITDSTPVNLLSYIIRT
jgi:hypothetical protein